MKIYDFLSTLSVQAWNGFRTKTIKISVAKPQQCSNPSGTEASSTAQADISLPSWLAVKILQGS